MPVVRTPREPPATLLLGTTTTCRMMTMMMCCCCCAAAAAFVRPTSSSSSSSSSFRLSPGPTTTTTTLVIETRQETTCSSSSLRPFRHTALWKKRDSNDDDDDWEDANDDDDDDDDATSSSTGRIEYDDFQEFFLGGAGAGGSTAGNTVDSAGGSSSSSSSPSFWFDDFAGASSPVGSTSAGDGLEGEDTTTSSFTNRDNTAAAVLQSRLQDVQQQERRHEAVFGRNWKLGNWQVRGFSLEDTTAASATTEGDANVVCRVTQAATDDDADHDPNMVWVGRTDGSIFAVKLGTDYWTKLSGGGSPESVNNEEMAERSSSRNDDDDDDDADSPSFRPDRRNPFQILAQVQTGTTPVQALAAASATTNDGTSLLFSASRDAGLQQWLVRDSENDNPQDPKGGLKLSFSKQLLNATTNENDAIQFLKVLSLDEEDAVDDDNDATGSAPTTLLLSADRKSIALWDLITGNCLGQSLVCRHDDDHDETDQACLIESVDGDGTHVYVGTSSGQVKAFSVSALLSRNEEAAAAAAARNIPPAGQWQASQDAVTAVHCGLKARMGASTATSRTLYTGDAQGVVKQWQVFARNSDTINQGRQQQQQQILEQWPKMATQRLPQKAHLFVGHDDAVRAIRAVDGAKFVTASADGTVRAWNAKTGRALFCMHGFSSDINSLCLLDTTVRGRDATSLTTAANTVLVTNGMDKYVCVHDFSNAHNDDEADFELEMPEYRNED